MSGDRMCASPRPPASDQRRTNTPMSGLHGQAAAITNNNHFASQRNLISQTPVNTPKMSPHVGSMPYLPGVINHIHSPIPSQDQTNTMRHFSTWGQQRPSLPGFNMPSNLVSFVFFLINLYEIIYKFIYRVPKTVSP